MHKQQNMGPAGKYMILFVILLAFLLLLSRHSANSCDSCWHLVVYSTREDRVLYCLPIKVSEKFNLTYTHSVTNTPVEGTFVVTGSGQIQPLTTSFDTFGPGLPQLDQSTPYSLEEGRIVVHHREEPRENIRIWVSALTGEHLLVGSRHIRLAPWDDASLLLEIFLLAH